MSNLPVLDVASTAGCCPPLTARALTVESAGRLAPMFKALGDPVRLRLLSLIAAAGEQICVCDLTSAFEVSAPTISHHLRVLREAGLVDCERRGTWVYYWTQPSALNQLAGLLQTRHHGAGCLAPRPAGSCGGSSVFGTASARCYAVTSS